MTENKTPGEDAEKNMEAEKKPETRSPGKKNPYRGQRGKLLQQTGNRFLSDSESLEENLDQLLKDKM